MSETSSKPADGAGLSPAGDAEPPAGDAAVGANENGSAEAKESSVKENGNDSSAKGVAGAQPDSSKQEVAKRNEEPKSPSDEDEDPAVAGGEDDDGVVNDVDNNELALLEEMEKVEDETNEPKPTVAPQLLQKALETGDVAVTGGVNPSEKTGDPEDEEKPKQSQLDFLLSKASEYSSFIAADLDELQASMAESARKKMERSEKRKRKGSSGKSSRKKAKTGADQALQDAFVKDANARAGGKPIFIQPPNLAEGCILKDYQLEGVRWLASLFENGVSGILADEMGLGKTIQVIGLIAHLLTQEVSGPFLVVAPLATLPNWVREIEKWLPEHPVVRYHGPSPEREAMLRGPLNPKTKRSKDFPIIVTSYETAIRDQNKLAKLSEFTYMIVDEGHRLKNHRCTLLRSLKSLKAGNRLLLTGTPIQNTLDELWSLLNFVNPAIFDDLNVFQSWFGFKDIGQKSRGGTDESAIILEERKNQTVTKLHGILRPFLLRRVKKDVLKDMPPKKEIIVYSGLSKLQLGYADLIEKGVLRDQLVEQGIEAGRNLSQTNKMMNHRKNVNHPFLFGEPVDPSSGVHIGTSHPQLLVRASGKFALLDRMLDRLHKDGHQVLIFSQMTKVLSIMEDYLAWRNWRYCRIDGSTNIDDRQKAMDVFNAEKTAGVGGQHNTGDDRYFVFLLSTRAGGLGINLTAADTCIIFDSDWNPHADSQAMDRCHRMGQTRPVAVYRLLTCNSVDIEMMEKQISKKKLERMTIAGGDFRKAGRRSQGDITFEKLQSLLQSDIKDMQAKGGDVEDIKISDDEFERIMDRERLFKEGGDAVSTEGKMYDILDSAGEGDFLGSMTT